jgi:phytoene dehydrogenase-like protein
MPCSTRGQISASFAAAAQNLLSLRYRYAAPVSTRLVEHTTQTQTLASSSKEEQQVAPSKGRFWTEWTNWYHTFLAEVTDEFASLPIAERRSEATSRWVTFTSKRLRCSESQVRAWLRTADQKALVAAYA